MADYANQPGKSFSRFGCILSVGLSFMASTVSWGVDYTGPKLSDPENNSLKQYQVLKGPTKIETTKFQHYYKGLEVIGSMVFQHKSGKGKTSIRNKVSHFDLDTRPTLSVETVASLAQGLAGNLELRKAPVLQILPSSQRGQQGSAKLIYWVELSGKGQGGDRDVLIDAHSGKLIADLDHNFTIAPIQVYSAKSQGIVIIPNIVKDLIQEDSIVKNCKLIHLQDKQSELISARTCQSVYEGTSHYTDGQCQIVDGKRGIPLLIDTDFCTEVAHNDVLLDFNDPDAAKALDNSKKVLNYYQQHFGRNSFDDQGARLVSLIHAGDQMANAFWNVSSNMMVYGEGDGKELGDFTESVDVAGHEMTHGVTSHTAKLIMMDESGALNEAFSDFFGKQIENEGNWLMGKNLFIGSSGKRGFRNLADPGSIIGHIIDNEGTVVAKNYPANKADAATIGPEQACDKTNDNCWVHFNATIPGHASYLIYQSIGAAKAELLYYTALTQNISANDDFESAAKAILETCDHLEYSRSECLSVREDFQKVGML